MHKTAAAVGWMDVKCKYHFQIHLPDVKACFRFNSVSSFAYNNINNNYYYYIVVVACHFKVVIG
jgi:hypothetical protein